MAIRYCYDCRAEQRDENGCLDRASPQFWAFVKREQIMRARCKENTREFSRLNDVCTTNRVNRASNALGRNQSVTSEPKRKKKRDTFHYFPTKIEGKKNWRETVKPLTLGIETGCRREERKEVCETGSGRKLEGRGLWSGLVWSGLVWSGMVCFSLLLFSLFSSSTSPHSSEV